MTLHDYMAALRKNWIIIVILAVVGGALGYAYALTQPDQYRSQSSVIVIPARGDNVSELVQGSNYVQNLVQTYTQLASSPLVLGPVINELGLDASAGQLASTLTIEAPLDTTIIRIAASNPDPVLARDTANAVADELASAVRGISPAGADGAPAVRIAPIGEALVSAEPYAPNPRQNAIIGLIAGLALGVLFALLRRLFARRLSSPADVGAVTDTPLLGEVLGTGGSRTLPSVVRTEPNGVITESLRSLVAGLRFANVDGASSVFLLTSAASGEGKSSISVAMSLILAETGQNVCLIDADLRRASVSKLTQLEGAVGLTSVLVGESTLSGALQPWGQDGLQVLTSGVLPPNPGQLLTSAQMRNVIEAARAEFDYVIIDSPPVLAVSDPLWLAPLVDGVIVVARARVTRRDALVRSLRALESAHTRIFGIVLNDAKRSGKTPYYDAETRKTRRGRTTAKQLAPERTTAGV